jgi:hypothetical protein
MTTTLGRPAWTAPLVCAALPVLSAIAMVNSLSFGGGVCPRAGGRRDSATPLLEILERLVDGDEARLGGVDATQQE